MDMRTETQLRVLRIVASYGRPCTAREFAMQMWPQSRGWAKPSKSPRDGVTHGAVMHTAGAAFLGRFEASFVVQRQGGGYVVTPIGLEYLSREGRSLGPYGYSPARYLSSSIYWTGSEYLVWSGHAWVRWQTGQPLPSFSL